MRSASPHSDNRGGVYGGRGEKEEEVEERRGKCAQTDEVL